jgi:hypothetical protein
MGKAILFSSPPRARSISSFLNIKKAKKWKKNKRQSKAPFPFFSVFYSLLLLFFFGVRKPEKEYKEKEKNLPLS